MDECVVDLRKALVSADLDADKSARIERQLGDIAERPGVPSNGQWYPQYSLRQFIDHWFDTAALRTLRSAKNSASGNGIAIKPGGLERRSELNSLLQLALLLIPATAIGNQAEGGASDSRRCEHMCLVSRYA